MVIWLHADLVGEKGHRQYECKSQQRNLQPSSGKPQAQPSSASIARPLQKGNLNTRSTQTRKDSRPARVNAMSFNQDSEPQPSGQDADIISGILHIHDLPLCTLFDSGASLSFISMSAVKRLNLSNPRAISTPISLSTR